MENIGLTFTDDALKAIARKAIGRKTGAQACDRLCEAVRLTRDAWAEVAGLS